MSLRAQIYMDSCLICLLWFSPLFDSSYPSLCSGMLPEAVLPPSKEHSYAQWLERTYQPKESRGPQAGKTDSLLSSVATQQFGASYNLPLHSHGMETIEACYLSCMLRNMILLRPFYIQQHTSAYCSFLTIRKHHICKGFTFANEKKFCINLLYQI